MALQPWEEIAQNERQRRDLTLAHLAPSSISIPVPSSPHVLHLPREYLSPAEIAITETPPEVLISKLASGELTSTETTLAFLQRARIAQSLVNCITELLPEPALQRAKELDEYFSKHGKPLGPLHGLPMSAKEHVGLEGFDQNAGFVNEIGEKAPADAMIASILKNAGVVFFARTTEPQGLFMLETISNIHGTTLNPHNVHLTSGGSSGGEAALLALRGSPLGISSDIGGSIRAPAANCGLYGLKPTTARIPLIGLKAPGMGSETVIPTIGPQSPTLDGIRTFMKVVLGSKPWDDDPSLHQIPWRDESGWVERKLKDGEKVRIGVMWDDGWVKPMPPVERALRGVVEKLRDIGGVEVVDWHAHRQDDLIRLMSKLYSPDSGSKFESFLTLSGEPWLPLTKYRCRDDPFVETLTLEEVWKWTMEREIYRFTHFQAWKAAGLDLLLCPAGASPAPQHGTSRYWSYFSTWNVLDYPAVVFPVCRTDVKSDARDETYTARNEDDKWVWEHYNVEKEAEAPIGLQLVGSRLQDEKVVEGLAWLKETLHLPFIDCWSR